MGIDALGQKRRIHYFKVIKMQKQGLVHEVSNCDSSTMQLKGFGTKEISN